MSIWPVEEIKEATAAVLATVQEKFGQQAGSLLAEEGGILDAIVGKVFHTLDGAKVTLRHPALKDPLTITIDLKKEA